MNYDGSYKPNFYEYIGAEAWGVYCICTDKYAWVSLTILTLLIIFTLLLLNIKTHGTCDSTN